MAVVTAPLVIAKLEDGSDVYLYEGAQIPGGLLEGEEKRLIAAGLVAEDVEPETGYASQSKAQLEAEIEARNAERAEEDKIVAEGKGNKPDLVAALEADDGK